MCSERRPFQDLILEEIEKICRRIKSGDWSALKGTPEYYDFHVLFSELMMMGHLLLYGEFAVDRYALDRDRLNAIRNDILAAGVNPKKTSLELERSIAAVDMMVAKMTSDYNHAQLAKPQPSSGARLS